MVYGTTTGRITSEDTTKHSELVMFKSPITLRNSTTAIVNPMGRKLKSIRNDSQPIRAILLVSPQFAALYSGGVSSPLVILSIRRAIAGIGTL
jgi:hypothetical protein